MRQPVIGLDFQSYLPTAIVPYMLLLVFNVFNRYAFPLCISACVWDFSLSASLQHLHQTCSPNCVSACPWVSLFSSCLSLMSPTKGMLIHFAVFLVYRKSILSIPTRQPLLISHVADIHAAGSAQMMQRRQCVCNVPAQAEVFLQCLHYRSGCVLYKVWHAECRAHGGSVSKHVQLSRHREEFVLSLVMLQVD